MKITTLCVAVATSTASLLAWGQTAAPAGDAAAGQRKTAMCAGCHGIEGWRTAYPEVYGVPKIGGQHPAYIVKALQEYKSGERGHPTMKAIAASLSERDMADLAAYYGGGATSTGK
jgi:cytochrome c553